MDGMIPKASDRYALQDEAYEAGNETCKEEYTDDVYGPPEGFPWEDTPIE